MTPTEVAVVIARLAAAWPSTTWSSETIDTWARQLGHVEPVDVTATVDACIRRYQRTPSVAEFLTEARTVTRRRRLHDDAHRPALPAGDIPKPDYVAVWLAYCREQLGRPRPGPVTLPEPAPALEAGQLSLDTDDDPAF